jgi:hypothetical protein
MSALGMYENTGLSEKSSCWHGEKKKKKSKKKVNSKKKEDIDLQKEVCPRGSSPGKVV